MFAARRTAALLLSLCLAKLARRNSKMSFVFAAGDFLPRMFFMSSPPAASMGTETAGSPQFGSEKVSDFGAAYRRVREFSEKLCQTLQPEDCVIQNMPEVSPTTWH